jgi:hypothetical protein
MGFRYLTLGERATILAALRYYQTAKQNDSNFQRVQVIATNGEECTALTPDEIGALCERINS